MKLAKLKAPIIHFDDLTDTRTTRQFGSKIVLAGGCFDILHLGHVVYLDNAKALGDYLIVALESDEYVIDSKKRVPFHNCDQRASVIAALRSVDLVVKMPFFAKNARTEGYKKLVESVKPAYIAVSENDKMLDKKKQHAKSSGSKVKVVTKILESLSSSTIAKYGALLSD